VDNIRSQHRDGLAGRLSLIYIGVYATNAFLLPRLDSRTGEYNFIVPMEKTDKMPIIDGEASTGVLVRALVEDEVIGTTLPGIRHG
jgi:hypothetical protein